MILQCKDIGKAYDVYHLRESASNKLSLRRFLLAIPRWIKRVCTMSVVSGNMSVERKWVLQDVNLTITQGEKIAVLGANGSGKTTLLDIFARIKYPSCGTLLLNGRVILLDIIAFLPDFTGRENVYFIASLLGMTKQEIDARFHQIVDFSGVGEFIDIPVKRYSFGMSARLVFSIGVHVQVDLLIIDEALAVVDFAFRRKCIAKLKELAKDPNSSLIFVGHNMELVEQLCTRAIYLRKGIVVEDGPLSEVAQHYLQETQD